jgi:hypothetical protein
MPRTVFVGQGVDEVVLIDQPHRRRFGLALSVAACRYISPSKPCVPQGPTLGFHRNVEGRRWISGSETSASGASILCDVLDGRLCAQIKTIDNYACRVQVGTAGSLRVGGFRRNREVLGNFRDPPTPLCRSVCWFPRQSASRIVSQARFIPTRAGLDQESCTQTCSR